MKISTKGRYALRVMIDLGNYSFSSSVSLSDIAKRQQISVKYLEQIMRVLIKHGYVKSERGAHGGYQLAKEPSCYTVGDILRAAEGSLAPISCLEKEAEPCVMKEQCATIAFWQGLYDQVNQYVDSYTLEDLMKQDAVVCVSQK